MMKYKSYTADLELDVSSRLIRGCVIDLADVITFQAKTIEEAEDEFHRAVDSYLEACLETGKIPEKPFSGKLPFRTTPEIHKAIFLAAKREGKSINAWMVDILSDAAQEVLQGRAGGDAQESWTLSQPSVSSYCQEHPEIVDSIFEKLTEFYNVGDDGDRFLLRGILQQILESLTTLKKMVKTNELSNEEEVKILHQIIDAILAESILV